MRLAVTALLLSLSATSAFADETSDRAAILNLYSGIKASLLHNSFQGSRDALASPYEVINEDNSTTSMTPSQLPDLPGTLKINSVDVKVSRLIVQGDIAMGVVTLSVHASKTVPPSGLPYRAEIITSEIDDWQRNAGRWQIVRETTLSTREVPDLPSVRAIFNATVARAASASSGGGGGGLTAGEIDGIMQNTIAMENRVNMSIITGY